MNWRHIVRITFILLWGIVVYVLIISLIKRRNDISSILQFPEIQALTLNGEVFNSKVALLSSKRTALVFFDPDCELCRIELDGIRSSYPLCRNVQWLFLTLSPSENVELFLQNCPLDIIPNAFILREDWPDIYHLYKIKKYPALFIYDENGRLMKYHRSATSIKTIVQELQ